MEFRPPNALFCSWAGAFKPRGRFWSPLGAQSVWMLLAAWTPAGVQILGQAEAHLAVWLVHLSMLLVACLKTASLAQEWECRISTERLGCTGLHLWSVQAKRASGIVIAVLCSDLLLQHSDSIWALGFPLHLFNFEVVFAINLCLPVRHQVKADCAEGEGKSIQSLQQGRHGQCPH